MHTSVLRGPPARGAVAGIIVQIVARQAERTQVGAEALPRVLANAFAGTSQVVLAGPDDEVARLAAAFSGGFIPVEELDDQAPEPSVVLALGIDAETLEEASSAARRLGSRVYVLVESGEPAGVRDRLRAGGLAVAEVERLLWRPPQNPSEVGSRAERLEAETEAVLLHCVLADDPDAVAQLGDVIARLREELAVRAQLEVDHAATREAERARADRLRDLEESFERLGGIALLPEVERLRAEIEAMRATRIWRLGAAWWRLRDRILRR